MSDPVELRRALKGNGVVSGKPGETVDFHKSKFMNYGDITRADAPLSKTAKTTGVLSDLEGNPRFFNTSGDEIEEREMFSNIAKPRVRYDVEVITKLIVYTGKNIDLIECYMRRMLINLKGIAWLAVEGNPLLFNVIGLGLGREHQELISVE